MEELSKRELKEYVELGRREFDATCRTCEREHTASWGFVFVEKTKHCFCSTRTFVRVYCPYCRYARYEDKELFNTLMDHPDFKRFCLLREKYRRHL